MCCTRYDGETLRFFMLRTHYRSPFNFSDGLLDDARNALRRLYTALDKAGLPEGWRGGAVDWSAAPAQAFKAAMDDDFNTPAAPWRCCSIWPAEVNRSGGGAASAALLKGLGAVLGVLQQPPAGLPAGWCQSLDESSDPGNCIDRAPGRQAGA